MSDLNGTVVSEVAVGTSLTPTPGMQWYVAVSYTHLRAHETVLDLVCRLLLEKKKHHRNV